MQYLYFADHASQYIYLNINQLDALNFYNEFISCLYMFRAHVLIIRRSKLYYKASAIITPIGGRPVHRLRVGRYTILQIAPRSNSKFSMISYQLISLNLIKTPQLSLEGHTCFGA